MKKNVSRRTLTEFLWFGWKGLLTVTAVILITCFGFLHYLAGFGVRQSVALALCFALCADATSGRPKAWPFRPFVISFEPNFPDMLAAIGLVESKQDWFSKIEHRNLARLPRGADPEKYGFSCTTLSLANEREGQVVAWEPWHRYSTEYRVSFPLFSINYVAMEGNHPEFYWNHPEFLIDWIDKESNRRSLGFGLKVKKDWWSSLVIPQGWEDHLFVVEEERGMGVYPDYLRLFFGVLPIYEMTRDYRNLYAPYLMPHHWDTVHVQDQLRLKDTGWEINQRGFEHKYLTVNTYGTEDYLRH